MDFSRLCFGYVPKLTFSSVRDRGRDKIHYIPNSQHVAKKLISGLIALLGVSALVCSVLAASMCHTFMPAIALLVLATVLLVLSYHQYLKAWTRLEIRNRTTEKIGAQQVSELSYFSFLRSWRMIALGKYRLGKNVHVYEGNREELRAVLKSRVAVKNGVALVQEIDCECPSKLSTDYQEVFCLPDEVSCHAQHTLQEGGVDQITAVSWVNKGIDVNPEELVYIPISRIRSNTCSTPNSLVSLYKGLYFQAFSLAVKKMTTSSTVHSEGACLLVSPIGIWRDMSAEDKHSAKVVSKLAFLQAVEEFAQHTLASEAKVTILFMDPYSVAPLRSIDINLLFPSLERLRFEDLSPESLVEQGQGCSEYFCKKKESPRKWLRYSRCLS
ncbi:hypothetical protein CP10139811_0938 [Chlamydia ibidis]|uniref:Uncharacterized protein n=2 Tax=Chlamydia ibidis TaxID=1405396 RepID=S7KGS0_9CHLA|nr:hypothetical protein [Chlamydia ibidis]EPP35361.1 hypothetical protein CP10139811_0938 [Chlamydia ibidis]EQM63047.1 hypothetical protein H359_0257 [Chlamydia ibidis 10-1398/6]